MSNVFEYLAEEYDAWYEKYKAVYLSEIEAIKPHLVKGLSLEIGVGSGRFAEPLKIQFGIDPAFKILKLAYKRGIRVVKGCAENLPFKNEVFDCVLFIVTICFLNDPLSALKEAYRVLKKEGKVIIAFIDKNSFLGKLYRAKKHKSKFYKNAHFYSVKDILNFLKMSSFKVVKITQTLFKPLEEIKEPEPVKDNVGEGSFIVISAVKNS